MGSNVGNQAIVDRVLVLSNTDFYTKYKLTGADTASAYNWGEIEFKAKTAAESITAYIGDVPSGQVVQLDIQDCSSINSYGIYAK